ncbi:hypothetical protein [Brachybacterium avium]|uniref:hypothetical protein n=1 Tax=Brachybacterium avium TaxID=2017485 RepID=UPI0012FD3488|nr:hypothetical protein [Brachybacterium avium]
MPDRTVPPLSWSGARILRGRRALVVADAIRASSSRRWGQLPILRRRQLSASAGADTGSAPSEELPTGTTPPNDATQDEKTGEKTDSDLARTGVSLLVPASIAPPTVIPGVAQSMTKVARGPGHTTDRTAPTRIVAMPVTMIASP